MLLDLCHFRSNNFLSLCVLYKRKKGGGGEDNHRARKIRVGQEPRKRKEKGGFLSVCTVFCSRDRGGPASKMVNYTPYTN